MTNGSWDPVAAVLITMIGVGVAGHQAPVEVTSSLTFAKGFLAVTDIVSLGYRVTLATKFLSASVADLRLRRTCRVFHFHFGDEEPCGLPQGPLCASNRGHVTIPHRRCRCIRVRRR